MKIGIASDHRGYETKQKLTKYLEEKGYNIIDYGTDSTSRVDYTKYAFLLGEKVAAHEVDCGIAICGSAVGISVACNKVKGIRCGKVNNVEEAVHAKECDFVNIIALSGVIPTEENINIVEAYLNAKENTIDIAYRKRKEQIEEYENNER